MHGKVQFLDNVAKASDNGDPHHVPKIGVTGLVPPRKGERRFGVQP